YNFHWQSTGFEAPRFMPNVIVTSFVAEAMWRGFLATGEERFKEATLGAIRFICEDLPKLVDEEDCICVGYVPTERPFVVVNVNAVSAGLMIKVWKATGDEALRKRAEAQLNFVERARTKYDAWFYTHPAGDSPIRHDNYHTGGILDGILDFVEATGDEAWRGTYQRGLAFYKSALFEADGAPRWMNDARYPHDVHGAAQGMITFARAKDFEMAEKIYRWARANLRRKDGSWSYQIGKSWLTTRRYTLMRWCNAWMCHAMATLLAHLPQD
ncbi:MAG: hypothetical protein KDB07_06040, partial [Planctomycetes bacterium]|nr:hypothetical protein [Planctomycetota bacterium]